VHALYGFMTGAERKLFLLLIGISGIGPKSAVTALSGLSVRDFTAAVAEGDTKRLSGISGIGKKTAERIVVELKDKITAGEALEALTSGSAPTAADMKLRDAILALVSLGYKQIEAQAAIKKVADKSAGGTVEDMVRKALAAK
ncbi:MAG TPA: Holliday junction branch migration protein RuvA, partial [Kiritimatiellia bacterium]